MKTAHKYFFYYDHYILSIPATSCILHLMNGKIKLARLELKEIEILCNPGRKRKPLEEIIQQSFSKVKVLFKASDRANPTYTEYYPLCLKSFKGTNLLYRYVPFNETSKILHFKFQDYAFESEDMFGETFVLIKNAQVYSQYRHYLKYHLSKEYTTFHRVKREQWKNFMTIRYR